MALLLKPSVDPAEVWLELFRRHMPDLEVRVWPDAGSPDEIEFALVRRPPPGEMKRYRNLRFIGSIPAGVDHLLVDPELPADVPIIRCVSPRRAVEMADYVAMHAMRFHRRMPEYEAMIRRGGWEKLPQPENHERRVGVMGLGELGEPVAQRLAELGFDTAGWTRTPRRMPGIANFAGTAGLEPFLRRTEILACLLPLTAETRGILNAETLDLLPRGAYLINCARGAHVVEADLRAALDSGQIAGACLDVLSEEPPSPDHPLLHHPRAYITPHISCRSRAVHMMDGILENIRRARAAEPLLHLVDRAAGY